MSGSFGHYRMAFVFIAIRGACRALSRVNSMLDYPNRSVTPCSKGMRSRSPNSCHDSLSDCSSELSALTSSASMKLVMYEAIWKINFGRCNLNVCFERVMEMMSMIALKVSCLGPPIS